MSVSSLFVRVRKAAAVPFLHPFFILGAIIALGFGLLGGTFYLAGSFYAPVAFPPFPEPPPGSSAPADYPSPPPAPPSSTVGLLLPSQLRDPAQATCDWHEIADSELSAYVAAGFTLEQTFGIKWYCPLAPEYEKTGVCWGGGIPIYNIPIGWRVYGCTEPQCLDGGTPCGTDCCTEDEECVYPIPAGMPEDGPFSGDTGFTGMGIAGDAPPESGTPPKPKCAKKKCGTGKGELFENYEDTGCNVRILVEKDSKGDVTDRWVPVSGVHTSTCLVAESLEQDRDGDGVKETVVKDAQLCYGNENVCCACFYETGPSESCYTIGKNKDSCDAVKPCSWDEKKGRCAPGTDGLFDCKDITDFITCSLIGNDCRWANGVCVDAWKQQCELWAENPQQKDCDVGPTLVKGTLLTPLPFNAKKCQQVKKVVATHGYGCANIQAEVQITRCFKAHPELITLITKHTGCSVAKDKKVVFDYLEEVRAELKSLVAAGTISPEFTVVLDVNQADTSVASSPTCSSFITYTIIADKTSSSPALCHPVRSSCNNRNPAVDCTDDNGMVVKQKCCLDPNSVLPGFGRVWIRDNTCPPAP